MRFDFHTDNGVTIVVPVGTRLDANTAPSLREALIGRIEAGAHSLLLDLSDIGFLDSSALGALIATAKRAGRVGHFGVAGVQPAVARLFALTHMDRVFTIHPSTAEAIARLSA